MQSSSIVLIVDDEPAALEALKGLLETEGYHLEEATSGGEGLTRALELQPDVILLDVMLPGMDGFEVCRRLRANPQLAEVPVVMITALDDQESRLQGIEAGADDFISKPYNKAELRARVRTITRLNRYRRLHIEHERFAWMLHQAQNGYLLVNDDDTITYANPRANLYLGYPTDEGLLTKKFLEVVQHQYRFYPTEAWGNWPEPVEIPRYIVVPETPTAHAFWLRVDQLTSRDIHAFGQLIQLCDVTEQITNQRDIRTFHSIVEHKLRTPLGHMKLFLELIQGRIAKRQYDDLTDLIQNATESARHLGNELNDIFNYISSSTSAHSGEGFHMVKFRARVDTLCAELEINHVNIAVPTPLLKECLTLTQSTLDLLLWEILENAKKFHPQHDPKIDVTVAPKDGKFIQILIQDNGIVLSPKQQLRVWIPYMQGEKYLTGQAPGMGLGLSLVHTLVWQTGGRVQLTNRSDQPGVVVDLILPTTGKESVHDQTTPANY